MIISVIKMEIKTYKKESFYSYTLGAFPTLELIKNHKEAVIKVLIHSSFKNEEVLKIIKENSSNYEISFNDKLISKLSSKENCYIIGIFNKYEMNLNQNNNHLLLVNPMNMGNFGTIIRSSLGFNIKDIALIAPCIDIFDPKVLRAAMGSFFSCNIKVFNSIDDYKKAYINHTINAFMLQSTNKLQNYKFSDKLTTLAFGNESSGLDISYLDENSIIIEHSNNIDSLNLPSAVGIALYEFTKQKS